MAFKTSLVPTLIPVEISADPNDPEVQAIAAFLRVLNALENIRSSIDVAERGRTMTRVADLRDLARLSLAETVDALEVLSEGALARSASLPSARADQLLAARVALELAQRLGFRGRSTACWVWRFSNCAARGRLWPTRPLCRRHSGIEVVQGAVLLESPRIVYQLRNRPSSSRNRDQAGSSSSIR